MKLTVVPRSMRIPMALARSGGSGAQLPLWMCM